MSRRLFLGPGLRVGALLLLLAVAGPLRAQSGYFEARSGSHELIDGVYYVSARIFLQLPVDAVDALHSRLPLTIRMEVEFLNRLRLWWDIASVKKSRRSLLEFHPLTNRYVVRDIDTNQQQAFVTLGGALEFIGQLDRLEIVAAAELDEDRRYDVRVRAVLDKDDLIGPMYFLSLFRRDWSVASEWLQWRLDEE